MKLNAKALFHNRDLWIVLGGGAAAITAVAVLSGQKGSPSPLASGLDSNQPIDAGPSGASANDDRLLMLEAELAALTMVHPTAPVPSSFQSFATPTVVSRPQAVAPPADYLTVGQRYYLENPGALSRAIAEAAPRNVVVAPLPAAPTVAEPSRSGLTQGQIYYLTHPNDVPTPTPAPRLAPTSPSLYTSADLLTQSPTGFAPYSYSPPPSPSLYTSADLLTQSPTGFAPSYAPAAGGGGGALIAP